MTIKLTAAVVRAAKGPTDGKSAYTLLSDTVDKGLGLRTTRAGAKAYTFSYTTKSGIPRGKTIGDVADWPLPMAREEARRLRRIVDQGGDPMGDLHASRVAPTIADLVGKWREEAAPKLRPRTRKGLESLLRLYILPKLGKMKVAEVERDDVERFHRAIKAKVSANRAVTLVHRLLKLATIWKMRSGDNPAFAIERNQEHGRERFLETEELERLISAVATCRNRQAANVVSLQLMTGSRIGEVLAMRWEQLSFQRAVWTKPASATKQKSLHAPPFSAPVLQLLSEIREAAEGGPRAYRPSECPWVFPNRRGDGHLGSIKNSWATICKAAQLTNLRSHDLRHAFATYLVSSGVSLFVVGKLLGHRQPQTTARYSHAELDPLRAAADKVAARIEAAKGGGKSAEVVPPRSG